MFLLVCSFLVCISTITSFQHLEPSRNCPKTCTCQLEHLSETAIQRFVQKDRKKAASNEATSGEFNDVFYEDNLESDLLQEKSIVRSAICILQNEIQALALIEELPEDIEALTFIQGYDEGTKTVKFSYLSKFPNLLSLELIGLKKDSTPLITEIDLALENLKYLSIENVMIVNCKTQTDKFLKAYNDDVATFVYVQKLEPDSHPLTMIQKGTNEEIIPYEKYIKQDNEHKIPLFIGFTNLLLLRITDCNLNNLHWTMFDGLQNLQSLILDKNNLKFIPPFAFYGTHHLKTLSLAYNSLLDIELTDLAGLLELEYLDLSHNNFSQLSELSLPPFPKLKLADFGNNPITTVFPNTFEVMNTTDSLIIGSDDVNLSLMPNSFVGLKLLKTLTLNNLHIKLLKRELFGGMPNLKELILTGNITEIEFDTFFDINKLQKLILNHCNLMNISMDAFMGLEKLEILDLSRNQLEYLAPGLFDPLTNIKELYLNGNKLTELPRDIFVRIRAKMIRLNDNPWHCSCHMSEWKPIIVNRIKQKIIKSCDSTLDKGVGCTVQSRTAFKYIFDTKVAPKCDKPKQYINWNVFHVMRRLLKCVDYKPKFRKRLQSVNNTKLDILHDKLMKHSAVILNSNQDIDNELNAFIPLTNITLSRNPLKAKYLHKVKKHKPMKNEI